ncbi:95238975-4397-4591-8a49-16eca74d8c11-CDS [Sclerotinia trifoliorum]|uniref:95238975-4397-4591-8a49-16eca74d8c11-CDS n=1 Tax=Sclerotinia trifoliorum TaxID=28548 RepID=A0A8H2ZQ82_9HELO|nr:95238975-4397-4591-8a49-16eca74d8c11-CDS [Sclerotinia trifoliorum]
MISLRNVFGKLRLNARTDIVAEAKEKSIASPLFRLPPEIISSIASMLPTPSVACLAICNRRMYHTLGPDSWKSLKSEAPDVLFAFLSLLAKDLPEHFLAIRQHLHGTDIGFPLEAFRFVEVEHDQYKQKVGLLSADAQIVSNEFLMRSQTWILLPRTSHDEFIGKLAEDRPSTDICIHTRLGSCVENRVSNLVRSRLDPRGGTREKCLAQTLQCSYCYMDFVFHVIDFGGRGLAVVITRWVNLGAGLDIKDAKWKSHITTRTDSGVHHPHHPGDIRKAFEGQEDLSVEELTLDNQMRLFSRRKNRLIYRGSDGLVWKWDQCQRWYLAPSGRPEMSFLEFLRRP